MSDIKYNEEQKYFIKSNIEDSCLLEIPGGGKTASIIGKIIYHFEILHYFTIAFTYQHEIIHIIISRPSSLVL